MPLKDMAEVSTDDLGVIKAYLGTGGEKEATSAPGERLRSHGHADRGTPIRTQARAELDQAILEIEHLTVSYGVVNAVRGTRCGLLSARARA